MSDGVLVANEDGKMLLLNPAAEQMVGHGSYAKRLNRNGASATESIGPGTASSLSG